MQTTGTIRPPYRQLLLIFGILVYEMHESQRQIYSFSEYNQQDATFPSFIYFCETLYMFEMVFPVHHQENQNAYIAPGICQKVTATFC